MTVQELQEQLLDLIITGQLRPDAEIMAMECGEQDAQLCDVLGMTQVEGHPDGWLLNIAVNHGI